MIENWQNFFLAFYLFRRTKRTNKCTCHCFFHSLPSESMMIIFCAKFTENEFNDKFNIVSQIKPAEYILNYWVNDFPQKANISQDPSTFSTAKGYLYPLSYSLFEFAMPSIVVSLSHLSSICKNYPIQKVILGLPIAHLIAGIVTGILWLMIDTFVSTEELSSSLQKLTNTELLTEAV